MAIINKPILANNTVINILTIDESLLNTWPLANGQSFGVVGGKIGDVWNGASYVSPTIPITVNDIVNERTRRLALGFNYDFGDERGIHHIGTTKDDLVGWDEVSKFATAAISLGNSNTTINIVTNTGPVQITALEWQSIMIAAAQNRQPIWTGSFVLQTMNPIPTDYTANNYWT